jgi:carboxypeptidase family protein
MKLNLAIASLLLSLSPMALWPQASNSTVRGTVRDQAQAVIPGATVTLSNTNTNIARTTPTNEAGLYVFPGVTPGPYRIAVESAGMQRFEGTLSVQVQQDAVVDVALQVGQTASEIEVADVTPLIQVDSPVLGHVLERKRIEQLPINGRGYQALLATVPGIDATGRVQAYGLLPGSHTLTVDGAASNEVWEGWDFGRPPGLDSIEEFQVETNNSSAKFTRPTTIVLSSRSGTNQLHGAMFVTNRNSGYGVARRREDNFVKPPFLNRNEYGASAGAPVYIPKLYNGRNRTFWFFAYEGQHNVTNTTQRWTVPTEAMRNGDFRGLVDSQGRQFAIYDPLTTAAGTNLRQQFAYRGVPNTIDPARLSPTAKYLFGITPLPTLPNVNPMVDNNWVGPTPRRTRNSTSSLRIDHRISDKDLIYGRYSRGSLYEEYQFPAQIMLDKTSSVTNRWWPNQTGAFTWIRPVSPTLINELMLTGTRDYQRRGTGDFKTDYSRTVLGLPNPFGAPNYPTISGTGLDNYSFGGDGLFWLISNYATLQDNATKIKGKHEFQFGFQIRWEDIPKSTTPLAGGFSFDTQATALYDSASTPQNPIARQFTGHNLANMYLGVANYTAQFRRPWWYFRRQEYAPYFQDNWKITPRLTLNLGLRYEFRTPLYDRNNTQLSFDFDKRAYVIGTEYDEYLKRGATLPSIVRAINSYGGKIITYKEAGLSQSLVRNNWKNFGPRLGFAYRALDGKNAFVIRGGYRISYYTQPIQAFVSSQSSSAPVAASFQNSLTNTALSPDGLPNYGLRSVPSVIAGVNSGDSIINVDDTRTLARGFSALFLDPKQPDPRVQDWNFTIAKELFANMVVKASYIGNHSDNIQQTINYNDSTPSYIWWASRKEPLPPGEFANVATRPYDQRVYGTINGYGMTGYTNYSGFQVELERRYSKGFAYQFFWVTGNTLAATASVAAANTFLPGAVPTDLDSRNRFLNYARDPVSPKNMVRWNWVADIPLGRGKKFGGSVSGLVDKFIGGWQLAGLGQFRSNYWSLPSSNVYPTGQDVEVYGYKYPIEDCRSGACFPGYLWWNGYIPANQINSVGANGRPNGVMGVPANYKPAAAPMIPWGSTTLPPNAPANTVLSSVWDTNTVWLPLNNGTVQRTTFNDNLHPWRNQFRMGVNQWFLDASVFKFASITEQVTLRFNADFFNVLNNPNNPTGIAQDGLLSTRNSGSAARTMQLTIRLIW